MRAFAFDALGEPGSIHDLPDPEPGDGQVRIKVGAGALNPFDNAVFKGFLKDRMPHHFPLVPCSDLAGRIEKLGGGVGQWKVGDEVFGILGTMKIGEGTLAEHAIATAGTIARRPAGLDVQFGAALPLAGVSAQMCIDPMGLTEGKTVVILGGAGGIGGFAVQLAKLTGAHVIAVTRSANADYVKGLGADEVIDYATQNVVDAVRKSQPNGIAGIVHTSGEPETAAALSALVNEGGYVTSMRGGAKIEDLAKRNITGINVMTMTTTAALEKLAALVETGKLKRPQIKTFELEDTNQAFDEIATGHARGKLVVNV